MPGLRLTNLTKWFGKTPAVQGLDLDVRDGEIMTFLGPSGCGKTTTLRCVAGLLQADGGQIDLGGERITDLPPERRGIGLVFQNYALWPHMTVYGNLAFGLQLRGVGRDEIARRVRESLALVRLSGYEERYPRQLSGGQQQRVALARALVIEPRLLLLDEPLSNLDAQLREEMRFEIRALQQKLGVTAVYVTHDQAEALALSDRIAVMKDGRLVQLGTPEDIYDRPANRFVAGFIGLTSFVEGTIARYDAAERQAAVGLAGGGEVRVRSAGAPAGRHATVAIRPEHLRVYPHADQAHDENVLQASVLRRAYLGDVMDYSLGVAGSTFRARLGSAIRLEPGETVWVGFSPADAILILDA